MMQDERWLVRYNEAKGFIEREHRNPSKHRIEEHLLLNFVKHNRKLLYGRMMKEDRIEKCNELLSLMKKYRRKNQNE